MGKFSWDPQGSQATVDSVLETLGASPAPPPPPPVSNSLTLRCHKPDGTQVFESEAPEQMPFEMQAAHVIMAMTLSGQLDDLGQFLSTLMDYEDAPEFISSLMGALMHMSDMIGGVVTLGGHRPLPDRFSVDNFPPPNRPKREPDTKQGDSGDEQPPKEDTSHDDSTSH